MIKNVKKTIENELHTLLNCYKKIEKIIFVNDENKIIYSGNYSNIPEYILKSSFSIIKVEAENVIYIKLPPLNSAVI